MKELHNSMHISCKGNAKHVPTNMLTVEDHNLHTQQIVYTPNIIPSRTTATTTATTTNPSAPLTIKPAPTTSTQTRLNDNRRKLQEILKQDKLDPERNSCQTLSDGKPQLHPPGMNNRHDATKYDKHETNE
ncbi:hypothetical protein CHS0354_010413 [Potamilus streckersoni]|uniref:Uncharacterized protein n=1 Tax=Potamilus streckersoni TaxID=2493646 RepID=A0AAE0RQQ1_9BIVA|nr:hypothetical protein CHS0354_010413 [Potamilus streckersoni]